MIYMKYTSLFGLLCMFALSSCGQVKQKYNPVSKADSLKLRLYEYKSSNYQGKYPDSALYYADNGLKLSRKLYYPFGEALMLNRLARINEQYGNLELAARYQTESLGIFNKLHHGIDGADATANLGILRAKQGDFATGKILIANALNQYQKSKDTEGAIRAYTKLAEVNELSGNLKQALEYYTKAEQLNQDRPTSDDYLALISSVGKLHTKMGNHQLAANYFEKGIARSGADEHIKNTFPF